MTSTIEQVGLESVVRTADTHFFAFNSSCELVHIITPLAADGDCISRALLRSVYGADPDFDAWYDEVQRVDRIPVFAFSADSSTYVVVLANRPGATLEKANGCDFDCSVLESLKFEMMRRMEPWASDDLSKHVLVLCHRHENSIFRNDGVHGITTALRQLIDVHVKNASIDFMFGSQSDHDWGDSSDFVTKNKGRYAMVVLHSYPYRFTLGLMPIVSSLLKVGGRMLWTTGTGEDQTKVRTLPEQTFARIVNKFDDQYADKWYVSFTDFQVMSPGQFIKT